MRATSYEFESRLRHHEWHPNGRVHTEPRRQPRDGPHRAADHRGLHGRSRRHPIRAPELQPVQLRQETEYGPSRAVPRWRPLRHPRRCVLSASSGLAGRGDLVQGKATSHGRATGAATLPPRRRLHHKRGRPHPPHLSADPRCGGRRGRWRGRGLAPESAGPHIRALPGHRRTGTAVREEGVPHGRALDLTAAPWVAPAEHPSAPPSAWRQVLRDLQRPEPRRSDEAGRQARCLDRRARVATPRPVVRDTG